MTQMTATQIREAVDEALEVSSRWPQLLHVLGFDHDKRYPDASLLNSALQKHGFGRVLDERQGFASLNGPDYPEAWWLAIAKEVAGNSRATAGEVVARLRESA